MAWNGEESGEKRVRMALNGAAVPFVVKGTGAEAPVRLAPAAPLLVGGDRNWSNVPIHLGAFAVYNQVFAPAELLKLDRTDLKSQGAAAKTAEVAAKELPQYEKLPALNKAADWATPPAPLSVQEARNDTLRVALTTSQFPDMPVLRLKEPVALDTAVKSVNFWICQPPQGKGAFSLIPLFEDHAQAEMEGPAQLFISQHSLPPNSRKAGLWLYRFTDVPRGARKFTGFRFKLEDANIARDNDPTDAVFIKDIGLERIDYSRAELYYVVGNFRGNFRDTKFNAQGARALTEASGGSAQPCVLLDNLVDQSKADRPKLLDLQIEAFDTADRRVWSEKLANIPAEDLPDLARPIPVSLTQPGTYRIRGKSHDSATGRFFTADWTKLVAIARNTVDAGQLAWLTKFVQGGGKLVMEPNAARFALKKPDAPGQNALLQALGVDFFADGAKLPGVEFPHDVYPAGQGQILLALAAPGPDHWAAALPAIVQWAGLTARLADSEDRHMQMHVLQRGEVHYLATTHRGKNQGYPDGPASWEGKVRFLKPLPGAKYRVSEMMSGQKLGEFTPADLAAGFEAGKYDELQMKIFRIEAM